MDEKKHTQSYRDLIVWQNAIKLAKDVYILARHFPKQETYALSDQVRRAAVSIPSNIAEGQARRAPAEFRRFIHIALALLQSWTLSWFLPRNLRILKANSLRVSMGR